MLRHIELDVGDAGGSNFDSVSMSEDAENEESEYSKKEKALQNELKLPSTRISETKVCRD